MLNISLQKTWKEFRLDVAFEIPRGKVTALFGPSGAGKSSILRIISGLERADGGMISHEHEVWFDDAKGIHLPPQAAFHWLCISGLCLISTLNSREKCCIRNKRKRRLNELKDLISLAGLSGYERYYPAQLSGGQKQRVALIRALARRPDILLPDETAFCPRLGDTQAVAGGFKKDHKTVSGNDPLCDPRCN